MLGFQSQYELPSHRELIPFSCGVLLNIIWINSKLHVLLTLLKGSDKLGILTFGGYDKLENMYSVLQQKPRSLKNCSALRKNQRKVQC